MSAIYGLIRFDGGPVDQAELTAIAAPITYWGPDGGGTWVGAGGGLGQLVADRTPEAHAECGPLVAGEAVVTAAARLDNRDELARTLGLAHDSTDSALVAAAYEHWGEGAPRHLLGDWAFAAFHPRDRRLFLARDQLGQTALYWHRRNDSLVFASSLKGILGAQGTTPRLNELRLAQHLVPWPTQDGAATLYEDVFRLPPAHVIAHDVAGSRGDEYWHPRDAGPIHDTDYVGGVRERLDTAIRTRARGPGGLATTLSAGLDSSAVTAFAAAAWPGTLLALTSVPVHPEVVVPGHMVDEWPLAHASAVAIGDVEHEPVAGGSPVAAMERSLWIHAEPEWAAGSAYWTIALLEQAAARGARTLLTGQLGNGGLSWVGSRSAVGHLIDARRPVAAAYEWGAEASRRVAAARARRRFRIGYPRQIGLASDDLARRLDLRARMVADGHDVTMRVTDPAIRRIGTLMPGVSPVGGLWHQQGAAAGLDVRDPTADLRLLEYCLGLPDSVYAGGGWDRLLVRSALKGRVPDAVRCNRLRGLQAADLGRRLVADADAVETALTEIADSPRAAELIALEELARQWSAVRANPKPQPLHFARGLQIGLFVARFGS